MSEHIKIILLHKYRITQDEMNGILRKARDAILSYLRMTPIDDCDINEMVRICAEVTRDQFDLPDCMAIIQHSIDTTKYLPNLGLDKYS